MASNLRKHQRVQWNYAGNQAEGKIVEKFTQRVTITIKGTDVTRNATADEPSYLIRQDDGDEVLKSGDELSAV